MRRACVWGGMVFHTLPGSVAVTPITSWQLEAPLNIAGDLRAFDALLTGDAYTDAERLVVDDVPTELEVLKVGHHGSDTSTDSILLARARPEVALVSAGRFNRYGHPDLGVLARLEHSGARVWRTDTQGTISVLARRDASYTVSGERRAPGASDR